MEEIEGRVERVEMGLELYDRTAVIIVARTFRPFSGIFSLDKVKVWEKEQKSQNTSPYKD